MDKAESRFLSEASRGEVAWRRRRVLAATCTIAFVVGGLALLLAGWVAAPLDRYNRILGAVLAFGCAGAFAVEWAHSYVMMGAARHLAS